MSDNFYTTLDLPFSATCPQIQAALLAALPRINTRAEFDQVLTASTTLEDDRLRAIHDAELVAPAEVRGMLAELRASLRNDPSNTASRLDTLAGAHPFPALLLAAGKALFASKQYSKARQIFQRLCELEPENVGALSQLGKALMGERRREEAIPILERAARLDPQDFAACIAVTHYWIRKGQFLGEVMPLLDRSLAACSGGAADRVRILASLLLPLAILRDQERLEKTREEILELLPRARLPVQEFVVMLVQQLPKIFAKSTTQAEVRFFQGFLDQLALCFEWLQAPDPQAAALEAERARLEADSAVPGWIRRLAGVLELLPEESPYYQTEERPAEEARAIFQAWMRVEGKQAEWAGFASGYPVLAGRIPSAFSLDCDERPAKEHARHRNNNPSGQKE